MPFAKQSKLTPCIAMNLLSLVLMAFLSSQTQGANFSLPLETLADREAMLLVEPYIQHQPKPPLIVAKNGYIHISGSRTQYQHFVRYWQKLKNTTMFLVEVQGDKKPKQMLSLQATNRNKSTRALGAGYARASQKLIGPLGSALRFTLNRHYQLGQLWLTGADIHTGHLSHAPLLLSIGTNDQMGEIILLPGPNDNSLNLSIRLPQNPSEPSYQASAAPRSLLAIQLGHWYNVNKPRLRQANSAAIKKKSTNKLGFGANTATLPLYIRVHRINI